LLEASDLKGTSMAMAVEALLLHQASKLDKQWTALLPLTAPTGADIDAVSIQAAINATGLPDVLFVDMKTESNNLYAGYLNEAIMLSLAGLVGIAALLMFVLRSPSRVLRMIVPLASAVLIV